MYLNGTTTGFLLQTMLYLANKTNKTREKNLNDFLQSPMGADSGKCIIEKKEEKKKSQIDEVTFRHNTSIPCADHLVLHLIYLIEFHLEMVSTHQST